jgi:hypothetical protein
MGIPVFALELDRLVSVGINHCPLGPPVSISSPSSHAGALTANTGKLRCGKRSCMTQATSPPSPNPTNSVYGGKRGNNLCDTWSNICSAGLVSIGR